MINNNLLIQFFILFALIYSIEYTNMFKQINGLSILLVVSIFLYINNYISGNTTSLLYVFLFIIIINKYNSTNKIAGGTLPCVPLNSSELELYFTNSASSDLYYKFYSSKIFFTEYMDTLIKSNYSYVPYFNDIEGTNNKVLYIRVDEKDRSKVKILGYSSPDPATWETDITLKNNIYYYLQYPLDKIELSTEHKTTIEAKFTLWETDLYNKIKALVDGGVSVEGKNIEQINALYTTMTSNTTPNTDLTTVAP